MNENERRAAARVKVSIPARYRLAGDPAAVERNGTIDNISHSGLLLVAGETFPAGTKLHVTFDDKRGGRHEFVAEIVRSQAMGGFGATFANIPEATREYVRSMLGVQ